MKDIFRTRKINSRVKLTKRKGKIIFIRRVFYFGESKFIPLKKNFVQFFKNFIIDETISIFSFFKRKCVGNRYIQRIRSEM